MATHITNATQLQNINLNLVEDYILDNDIDLTGIVWTPIGEVTAFTGTFDGQGNTISNLTIDNSGAGFSMLGLFSEAQNATIQNINLANVNLIHGSASGQCGGLIGNCFGTTIYNCNTSGVVVGTENIAIGGLVGYFEQGTINKCFSIATVTGEGACGGFIGELQGTSTITNCYSKGDVLNTVGSPGTIAGGFIGYFNNDCIIRNCYSVGNVSGADVNGGFLGYCQMPTRSIDTTVENCFSVGTVQGTGGYDGGFIGEIQNAMNVINCAWHTGAYSIAIGAFDAQWASGTGYANLRYIYYNNALYRSLQGNNLGNQPDISPAWWQFIQNVGSMLTDCGYGTDETTLANFKNNITHAVFAQGGSNPWDITQL